jgi:hypothetical protein
LGPFWITISFGAFIAGSSFIYMPLVGGNAENYLPYLAFGFVAWQLISNLASKAPAYSSPMAPSSSNSERHYQASTPLKYGPARSAGSSDAVPFR